MRVLALDTAEGAGSVALVEDGVVVEERAGDASRTLGERLPGELLALLDSRGLPLPSIDVLAVGAGPGSFTGLRIGIATLQALAVVMDRSIVPVSALDALAHLRSRTLAPGDLVAAWIDAHRGEVFSALYQVASAPLYSLDRLTELEPPAVASPAMTLAAWSRHEIGAARFVGSGAARYAETLMVDGSPASVQPPACLAGVMGLLASARARRGEAVPPAAVRPLYIRRPDAELGRERLSAGPQRERVWDRG